MVGGPHVDVLPTLICLPLCTAAVDTLVIGRWSQALIQRVAEEVEAESGVELEQLINPAKVHMGTTIVGFTIGRIFHHAGWAP